MRLFELKKLPNTLDEILNEGLVPIHLTMILDEIIAAGKCTNIVHYTVLSYLLQFFKQGDAFAIKNYWENPPMGDVYNSIRDLESNDQVNLADWFLRKLSNTDDPRPACCNAAMATNEWVRWVLQRQD